MLEAVGSDDDVDAVLADEHRRFDLFTSALTEVAQGDERHVLEAVLHDPDEAMREAAVLAHVDRAALLHYGVREYEQWRESLQDLLERVECAKRRANEWIVYKRAAAGEGGSRGLQAKIINGTDWLQRKLSEDSTSEDVLAALATMARTRRVRAAAAQRLRRIRKQRE